MIKREDWLALTTVSVHTSALTLVLQNMWRTQGISARGEGVGRFTMASITSCIGPSIRIPCHRLQARICKYALGKVAKVFNMYKCLESNHLNVCSETHFHIIVVFHM